MSDSAQAVNPYPGLRPFRADEEHLFFGRDDQVDAMIDKLAQTRLLAVVGSSGSGKSSLVNCGLIPGLYRGQLDRAGSAWRVAVLQPGNRPLRALAEVLCQPAMLGPTQAPPAGFAAADLMLATLSMSTLGLVDAFQQARLAPRQNLLVVVDQFEELFRYQALGAAPLPLAPAMHAAEQPTAFVKLLLAAVTQTELPIWIVLTMRSDFLGDCAQFFGLPEAVSQGQYLVPRMTHDERRAAISEPLRVTGTPYDPALISRLINDGGDNPDQLSILQHALNRTWARWQQSGGSGKLALTHYELAGTLAGALDQHAEEAYAQLQPGRQQAVAEALFRAITDRVTDARGTRRPTHLDLLANITAASAEELTAVINVFRDPQRSFLMPPAGTDLRDDSPIDISHESLMRVWARLRGWGEAEAQSARTYRRLAETAEMDGRGQTVLRQPELQIYIDWNKREQPNPAWAERYRAGFKATLAYLQRSVQADAQERLQAQAKLRRRWVAATGLFVLLAGVAASYFRLYQQAESQRLAADQATVKATDLTKVAQSAQANADEAQREAVASRNNAEALLAWMIGEHFLEKLRPVGRTDLLEDVQNKVQHYLDQSHDRQGPSGLLAAGLARRNEGDILLQHGELSAAIERFGAAAASFERLAAPPTAVPEASAEQARALARLGDALLDQGKTTKALDTHHQALALRQRIVDALAGASGDDTARIELSMSHSAAGRTLNRLGRPREALDQHLNRALVELEPLRSADPPANLRKALHEAHDNRAEALDLLDDRPGKRKDHGLAHEVARAWRAAHPLSADARQREVTALSRLADAQNEQGGQNEALKTYQRIHAQMAELVQWDSRNALWQRDLQVISLLMAESQSELRDPQAARSSLDASLRPLSDLARIDLSDLSRKRDLGWFHTTRAHLMQREQRQGDAIKDLELAERLYAEAAAGAPDDVGSRRDGCIAIYELANAYRLADQDDKALPLLRRGRSMLSALIRAAPQMRGLHYDLIAYFYAPELQILERRGPPAEAELASVTRQMQRAAGLAMALPGQPGSRLLHAASLAEAANARLSSSTGQADPALAGYGRALSRIQQATVRDPKDPFLWDHLGKVQAELGDLYRKNKAWSKAEAAYREAAAASVKAFDLAPQQSVDQVRNDLDAAAAEVIQPASAKARAAAFSSPLAAGQGSAVAPTVGGRANWVQHYLMEVAGTLESAGRPIDALAEFANALAWIKKAIERDGEQGDSLNNRRETYRSIAIAQSKLGRPLDALAAYRSAVEAGEKATELARVPALKSSPANRVYLLHIEAGDLLAQQKDHPAALDQFNRARRWIDQAIANAPTVSVYLGNLAALHRRSATQRQMMVGGAGDEAAWRDEESGLRDSVGLAERAIGVASAHERIDQQAARWVELQRAFNQLARRQAERKDFAAALASYRSALAALQRAASLQPGEASNHDAMRLVQQSIAGISGSDALTAWRAAADAGLRAAALGQSAGDRNRAALGLFNLGNHHEARKDWREALSAFQQASREAELAVRSAGQDAEHRTALSACLRKSGQMLMELPNREAETVASFEAAISSGKQAVELAPGQASHWHNLFLAKWYLAIMLDRPPTAQAALAMFRQALADAEQARKIDPDNPDFADAIANLQKTIAEPQR